MARGLVWCQTQYGRWKGAFGGKNNWLWMNATFIAFLFFFTCLKWKCCPFLPFWFIFLYGKRTPLLVLASQESNDAPLAPFHGNTHITWSRMTEKAENSVILTIQKVKSAFKHLDTSGFKKSFKGRPCRTITRCFIYICFSSVIFL